MLRNSTTSLRAALLCSALLVVGSAAAKAATVPGNVASWAPTAKSTGSAPDSQRVSIVVHLAMKDLTSLKQLVADVSKPSSPRYGEYLTATQFANRFAPDASDVSAVQAMLAGAGMKGIRVGTDGAYVAAVATVAQLRSTFAVSQDLYKINGRTMRANKEEPTIPAELAGKIVYIEGLDDTSSLKRPMHVSVVEGEHVAPREADASGITPPPVAAGLPSPYCDQYFGDLKATLSTKAGPYGTPLPWLGCGYTPQQVQAAYGMDKVTQDGTGITVAILDAYASPTLKADANRYAAKHNLPALDDTNFKQHVPAGIYMIPNDPSVCGGEYGWWEEQSLDVSAVHGSAPGANILYVGSEDCDTSLTTALADTILGHDADVITNSYSYNGEVDPATEAMQDQTLMAAGAEGITVMFSSGDDGDLSQINGIATGSYESTSPYATAVGGTSLAIYDSTGKKGEWGWGNYRDYLDNATVNSGTSVTTSGLVKTTAFGYIFFDFAFYSGSGGGISLNEPQPAYQAGIVPTALATTLYTANGTGITLNPRRVAPDISMVGDPYTGVLFGETFTIAGDPLLDSGCTPYTKTKEYCENDIGGTSLSSPLTAGVVARVDQARKAAGKPMVGFANPMIYAAPEGAELTSSAINQVLPPKQPTAVLRGYANNLNRIRVVSINSVPLNFSTTPYALEICGLPVCEGLDDVFNYVTPGYNDVTGRGVPYLPYLVKQ